MPGKMPRPRAALLAAATLLFLAALPANAAAPESAPVSAADAGALARAARDSAVETLPGGFAVLIPERFAAPQPVREKRYGFTFARAIAGSAPVGGGTGGRRQALRATVHHDPDQRDPSVRTARLIARLLRLHAERFGRDAVFPRGEPVSRLYVCPTTPPGGAGAEGILFGGETRGHEVYLYGAGTERTPLEWTRTVIHEWGHATLPAARGYSEPESDASGYLGERLYFKWLFEEATSRVAKSASAGPRPDDGTGLPDLELYHRRQVAPLIARFDRLGPSAPGWGGVTASAMDLYIGAALAFDDTYGSALLGDALFGIEDVRPRDLLRAMEEALARRPGPVPVRLPAWVPLSPGRYRVAAQNGGTGRVQIPNVATLSLDRNGTGVRVRNSGWRRITKRSGAVSGIYLRRERAGDVGR